MQTWRRAELMQILNVILTGKVAPTDLVFGVRSGFISRPVHTRLQVSMCNDAITICITLVT